VLHAYYSGNCGRAARLLGAAGDGGSQRKAAITNAGGIWTLESPTMSPGAGTRVQRCHYSYFSGSSGRHGLADDDDQPANPHTDRVSLDSRYLLLGDRTTRDARAPLLEHVPPAVERHCLHPGELDDRTHLCSTL
jgi:hypothetical protein